MITREEFLRDWTWETAQGWVCWSNQVWPVIEKLQQEKAALRTLLRGEKA